MENIFLRSALSLRCFYPCLRSCQISKPASRAYRRAVQQNVSRFAEPRVAEPGRDVKSLLKNFVDDELNDVEDSNDADMMGDDFIPDQREIARRRQSEFKRRFKRLQDPREPCLLKWAARCQVKYLAGKYPDEWDANKISQYFPISEADAERLIRHTNIFPVTRERLAEHDKLVEERWKALKKRSSGNMVTSSQRKRFLEGSLPYSSANGISSLPMPDIPIDELKKPQLAEVKGPFTALLKTHIALRNERLLQKYPELAENSAPNPNERRVALNGALAPPPAASPLRDPVYHYVDSYDDTPKRIVNVDDQPYMLPEDRADEELDTRVRKFGGSSPKYGSRPMMHKEMIERVVEDSGQPEAYQKWLDTFRMHDPKLKAKADENRAPSGVPLRKVAKYSRRNSSESDLDQRISIPQQKRRPGGVYQLKDTVYDEQGEFFYRVPKIPETI